MKKPTDRKKNGTEAAAGGDCPKCALGRVIINTHLEQQEGQRSLPEMDEGCAPDHDHGHRIRVGSNDGWAWQYHVNLDSVRVDRFSESGDPAIAVQRYSNFLADRNVNNHDFGGGITGNGLRSIAKSVGEGANANAAEFPWIAGESVNVMEEIYNL